MNTRLGTESGVALVEVLIAVAILGMTLVVFMGGLSTGLLSTGQSDRLSTAHELARAQLELTKDASYTAAPYSYPTVAPPAGYTVTSTASAIAGGDTNIELITAQVMKGGSIVFSLDDYKVNR